MTTPASVAVATRDRPESLARCLRAIAEGTTQPTEILVVDQGDPRGTSAVIDSAANLANVRHIPSALRGLSRSRNVALEAATTPVLAMTDDDCMPGREWLSSIAHRLDHDGEITAVTGPVLPAPSRGGREHRHAISSRSSNEYAIYTRPARPWTIGSGGNFAVRIDRLRSLGGFDPRLGAGSSGRAAEDLDVFLRLLRAGARIAYVPEAFVRHERQPSRRRWVTRWTYGYGFGALLGLQEGGAGLNADDLLSDWLRLRAGRAFEGARRGRFRLIAEEAVVVAGTARGILYGRALRD